MGDNEEQRKPHMVLTRRYSCMYTPDIAKKGKTYHDGYLVYHHMNSKMLLFDDKFGEIDDCFFRLPGIRSLCDVPKQLVLSEGTEVNFDRHIATVDQLVFEEERDVSDLWVKKKKDLNALDDLADADEEEAPPRKRARKNANESPLPDSPPSRRQSTPIHRGPPRALNSVFKPMSMPLRPPSHLRQMDVNSPLRATGVPTTLGDAIRQANAARASPKASTPFKAPTFVHGSSPQVGSSAQGKKRSLGTTRPSSMVAFKSLQSDWAKFADGVVNADGKKGQDDVDPAERLKKAKATLERLKQGNEEDFVPVNEASRIGEEGDTSDWLFD